jgi:1,4-alpha-glucan branching enzyme
VPKGYLAFVLHAHLPYVRHPEHESFLEERWLFEAITETYIPLIKFLGRLAEEEVPFRLTVSISPSLLAMMEDPLLQGRYEAHLSRLVELSERELARTAHEPHLNYLAGMYRGLFLEAMDVFVNQCGRRLSSAFGRLHDAGVVELMTTTATHAILPLMAPSPGAVAAQIATGLDYFQGVFGFRPAGIWLPECGYYPGLEESLSREGVRFFVLESHGIEHASTTPFHSVYSPIYTPSGIAAFGRDQGSTRQVWSAREGFPGDPVYREFYRDIGHDLDFNYIKPYIEGDVRVDTGIKYHRITGPTSWKEFYHPEAARHRAAQHAGDFLWRRVSHVEYLSSVMETAPVVVAPFDAELFGHWWFEGPEWLDFVIRKAAFDQDALELTTLSEYLDRHPVHQSGVPCASTWGHKGYFEAWLNGKTDWIYPQLAECCRRMEALGALEALARRPGGKSGKGRLSPISRRALNQCLRELLLAQSSDWPFMINNGTSAEYAVRRVRDHVGRFHLLAGCIEEGRVDAESLAALEQMDNIFPKADYRAFGRREGR